MEQIKLMKALAVKLVREGWRVNHMF